MKPSPVNEDRQTYLRLLKENLVGAGVGLLAWCLMTNHLHLIVLPAREDSLSILLRRVHGALRAMLQRPLGTDGALVAESLFRADHLWAATLHLFGPAVPRSELDPIRLPTL